MNDKELDAYCGSWVAWCISKKYFIAPGSMNILARMQPSKTRPPPNARLDAEMSYFNMALHALADMDEHKQEAKCFTAYYVLDSSAPVKAIAAEIEVSRASYYRYAHKFARLALSMAGSLERVHNQPIIADAVVD